MPERASGFSALAQLLLDVKSPSVREVGGGRGRGRGEAIEMVESLA